MGAATSQKRGIVDRATKIEMLRELRPQLAAEALNAYRYGCDDPDAVKLRIEICTLLDRIDRRLAREAA